jgi:hypothetical protein
MVQVTDILGKSDPHLRFCPFQRLRVCVCVCVCVCEIRWAREVFIASILGSGGFAHDLDPGAAVDILLYGGLWGCPQLLCL